MEKHVLSVQRVTWALTSITHDFPCRSWHKRWEVDVDGVLADDVCGAAYVGVCVRQAPASTSMVRRARTARRVISAPTSTVREAWRDHEAADTQHFPSSELVLVGGGSVISW